jgi:undecaprenyl-diphosphatase
VNYQLFRDINDLSGNAVLDTVMKDAARYLIFAVLAVLAALCLLRLRNRLFRPVVATVAVLAITFGLGLLGAAVYPEKRPFVTHHVHKLLAHTADQSFPSDHAMAAFGVAFAVTVFLSRRWGILLWLAALLIGFARVYDGIHYPLDIAGGFLAALIATLVVWLVARLTRVEPRGYARQGISARSLSGT